MSPTMIAGAGVALSFAAAIAWGFQQRAGRADEAAARVKAEASLELSRAQVETLSRDLELQNEASLHLYQVTEAARAKTQAALIRERVKRGVAEQQAKASEARSRAQTPPGADCRLAFDEIRAEWRP